MSPAAAPPGRRSLRASFVVDPPYRGDRLFDLGDARLNRDDCLYPYHLIRERFAERGVVLATCDLHRPEESDLVLYLDMPRRLPSPGESARSYLLALESPLIKPENFSLRRHARFRKVFTWDDRLVDGRRYVKVNYSFRFPAAPARAPFRECRLACMIAANKGASFPGELYSRRLEIARWYGARRPGDFDLYGVGWDRRHFRGPWRRLNRFGWLARALWSPPAAYRGRVDSKTAVMSRYRFAFALENISGVPGYITEKIFDCFFAGCVPVYLGAPNVTDYVPKEAFVDMRDYPDMDALHAALAGMGEAEHLRRQEAMREFLGSAAAAPFTADRFARTVVDAVLEPDHAG